ncbi:hypothetical protein [Halobacteriovorax marinus]|uniref:hypothetical protein n=1 Tax=Halobacteriovorax marinus TaxID=97084 RepID=UPI003A8EB0A1
MKIAFVLLLLLSLNSMAQVDKNLCNLNEDKIIRRITPKYTPNYFFKTSPDGRYIYYIGGHKNWRLDTTNGEELLLPGSADPVPSIDGKIMTSINWRVPGQKNWSLNLMPMENWDISRGFFGKINYEKVTVDTNTERTYQSVGTLGENKYRVLSYDERAASISLKDYTLTSNGSFSANRNDNQQKFPNMRLPMISKDGKEFASLDIETNQTVIYRINDDGTGAKEIERLDFPSGKVDFSSDRKKLVFHVTEKVSRSGPMSSEVNMPPTFDNRHEVRNVFVYDRETKSITPVTQNQRGNSYYPVFLEDDKVVYLDQTSGKLSFVIKEVPKVVPKSIEVARSCFEGDDFDRSLENLADLWKSVCTDWTGNNSGGSKVMMLNMPDELCRQIAKATGDREVSLMCDALKKSEIKRPRVSNTKDKFKKMVKVKCMICHQENIPFFDKEKVKSHKDEILKRINSTDPSYRMPLGGELTKEEKKEFTEYFNSL